MDVPPPRSGWSRSVEVAVSAVNAGGESTTTEVVTVKTQ